MAKVYEKSSVNFITSSEKGTKKSGVSFSNLKEDATAEQLSTIRSAVETLRNEPFDKTTLTMTYTVE